MNNISPFKKAGSLFRFAVVLSAILFYGGRAFAQPSDEPLQQFWRTDGSVQAVLVTNGVTYLGGAFTYVGPDSGSAGVIDLTTAQARRGFPKIDGTVFAATPDGFGGWFIGGSFTNVGNLVRTNLAHINADNSVDPLWIAHLNGVCQTMILAGGQLYIGGGFTRVGALTRNRIAAVNSVTAAVASWNPNAGNVVNTLILDASATTLYVGGNFTTIGSSNRTRIAALNLATGFATSWDPVANSLVTSIAIVGNTVYAGGNFTTIGTQPRNRIAALDATAANGLASAWNPNILGGGVSNLVVSGSVAYVAGSFTTVAGISRNGLAAIDVVTALPTVWNPNPNTTNVNTILLTGGALYAGGSFTSISGTPRRFVAALDPTTGAALPWAPAISELDQGIPSVVYSLSASNNQILVGGTFVSIGGSLRNNIAAVNNANGEATAWDANSSGTVSALAFATNAIYAGGSFTNIGGQLRNSLAALSETNGAALGWNPDVRGRAGVAVLALAVSSNLLYVGGINTTNVGGSTRTNLFAVNLGTGNPTAWNPATFRTATVGSVNALAIDRDTILAGGDFVSVGGQARTNLAAIGANGTVESWSPNPNNIVYAVAVSSNTVYAGGTFTTIGTVLRNRIAAVDRTTGLGILTWNPDASGTTPRVNTLAIEGPVVYVGGQFNIIGGTFRTNGAAILLSNGQAAAWQPRFGAMVRSLVVAEAGVFAGGDFLSVAGKPHSYFAVFTAGPEIILESLAVTAGHFGFQVRSGQGTQVVIQRTAGLETPNWIPISTNTVTGSPIVFSDPEFLSPDRRFYRAVLIP